MQKIGEHSYLISEEEVTQEMISIGNGVYIVNDDVFTVETHNNVKSQKTLSIYAQNKSPAFAASESDTKNNIKLILYILSILFLSFAILCIYNGINHFCAYEKLNDTNSIVNNPYFENTLNKTLRDGWLWFLGGLASLFVGIGISIKYIKNTNPKY